MHYCLYHAGLRQCVGFLAKIVFKKLLINFPEIFWNGGDQKQPWRWSETTADCRQLVLTTSSNIIITLLVTITSTVLVGFLVARQSSKVSK